MPTNVVMPQMGESITEGTIVRWIKKVGDAVDRDDPLFEISTDKVDAEIPSPAAGVISEIRHAEGETVAVDTVVAVIAQATDARPAPPATSEDHAPAAPQVKAQAPAPTRSSQPDVLRSSASGVDAPPRAEPAGTGGRQRSSPLVRRIAKEHQINIAEIHGTGIGGRVTRDDILAFIGGGAGAGRAQGDLAPAGSTGAGQDRVEKMSVMRRKIAEHMIASRRTAAHVHSVFEVDFSRVDRIRKAKKAEHERSGIKLTFLSFILHAVASALRVVPLVNASLEGDNVVHHKDVNLGIAVALDWGLIVPVIKNADQKTVLQLSRSVADLAARARAKQLKPEEVAGGTFTVTNPGVFGALLGMPIINQPQSAILAIGSIEKRPIVVDDAIAIGTMGYLTLGFDHRLVDGAVADQFLSDVKHTIENWDGEAGL